MPASNIPWLQYVPRVLPENTKRQELSLCPTSDKEPLRAVLTSPKGTAPLAVVITCAGIYRCTEGPNCAYNILASTLPAGGLAVLQLDFRMPHDDVHDAVRDIGEVLRDFGQIASPATPVLLIGWSMGGAAVIRAALKHVTTEDGAALQPEIRGLAGLATAMPGKTSLAKLCMPVLLIHGAGDDIVSSRASESIAVKLPEPDHVQLVVLPAISHKLEDPSVPDTIIEWCARSLDLPGASFDAAMRQCRRGAYFAGAIQKGSRVAFLEDNNDDLPVYGIITGLDYKCGSDEPRFHIEVEGAAKKRRRLRPELLSRCEYIDAQA